MRRTQQRRFGCSCVCGVVACLVMHGQVSVNEALRARTSHSTLVRQGDAAPAADPVTLADALQAMFSSAEIVFSGEVIRIERGEDIVTVRFAVEDGVRGVSTGSTYELHEWSGLWSDDAQRYAAGQHRLMLLRAPSVTGLASPVRDGAIAFHGDGTTGSADLRWVALHIPRSESASAGAKALMRSAGTGTDMLPVRRVDTDLAGEATVADDAGSSHVERAVIMDMLHAWQQRVEQPQ